ncbi:hypothetical protein LZD48_09520 [Oceanobacillus sp. APA_J-2(6-2)]|nr:hypothetical protein [Oceanobacillus alkalisoli]MCF3943380.1 hypothetical protein [Oceanobacillus alkalisoli]
MEIESAVLEVPGVSEAAVIGAPNKIKGEVPIVFVTVAEGYIGNEDLRKKIEASIVKGIGQIAKPRDVFFVEAMPKTVSGKIMRRLLKELQVEGDVAGDVTGLEDPAAIQQIKEVVTAKER